jgi:3-oxoacyl-[acyl-carrier-protein] synthase-3
MVGSSLLVAGFAERVLCVQSVAYSRVADPTSSSAVQEGDMASAFVLGPSPGTRMAFGRRTDGSLHAAIRLNWGKPSGQRPRRFWEAAPEVLLNHFDPELQAQLMGQIEKNAPIVCGEALERAGMRTADVEVFVTHQATYWQLSFIEDVLGLPLGVGFDTFAEYTNINSAGIPASLFHARKEGKISQGKKVLIFGPAAGYTYAAAAIHW